VTLEELAAIELGDAELELFPVAHFEKITRSTPATIPLCKFILDSHTFPLLTVPRLFRMRGRDSRLRPWLWTTLVFTLLAIGAQFLPLSRELHYELSALAALWTSLGAGLASLVMWWRDAEPRDPAAASLGALGMALLSTAPPLAVSLAHNLLTGACGLGEGLLWYLLLVPASALVAVAVARLARTITSRRWVQVVVFIGLWGASMARGAFEALSGPHIYLYAWQIGFFPGGSWDPELPITPLLLIYRASHVLIAAMLLLALGEIEAVRLGARRRVAGIALPAALVGAIVIALLPLRSDIGLTRTDAWLRTALGDSVRTRFTTIYYDASSTDSLDIWRAANYADFYVWRHARTLGIDERHVPSITFYAYASGAEQKRLVGTSSASFTKPWRRTLNLSFDRVEGTLEHELAHIVLAPYGNLLGVSWSNGILEGSAVALEHGDDAAMLHRHARAAYDVGLAPSVTRVMSATGFAAHRASLSYTLAGSFCRWLIDTYGAKRFVRAYSSGALDDVYDRSVDSLAAEHRRFLDALPPTDAELAITVRHLHGGGSFFLQRCLRRLATLSGMGYRALAEERYDEALDYFRASLDEGITSGARAGIIRALHDSGRHRELIDSMRIYIDRDSLGAQLLPYQIELSDALSAVGGGFEDQRGRYRSLHDVLRTGPDEWTRARAALRLCFSSAAVAMRMTSPPVARSMNDYYLRPMSGPARVYLLGEIINAAGPVSSGPDLTLLRLLRCNLQARSTPLLASYAADSVSIEGLALDSAAERWHYNDIAPGSIGDIAGDIPGEVPGFAACALLRTLNDAVALRFWSDGVLSADERRAALKWVDNAYHYPSPVSRGLWRGELVLADRPRGTFVGFLQYLDWFGAIRTPRSRR
jgi:hypothetical protein